MPSALSHVLEVWIQNSSRFESRLSSSPDQTAPEHAQNLLCDPLGMGPVCRQSPRRGLGKATEGQNTLLLFPDTIVSALELQVSAPMGSPLTCELGGDAVSFLLVIPVAGPEPCSELASACTCELRQLGGKGRGRGEHVCTCVCTCILRVV